MLRTRPLSDLLSQALSPSLESAILFTKSGSLLAQSVASTAQNRSRVVAALAASLWSSSADIEDADMIESATRGSDWICVTLESSRLLIQDIGIIDRNIGVASEGLLLALQGKDDAHFGYLRIQARKVKDCLETEFAKITG